MHHQPYLLKQNLGAPTSKLRSRKIRRQNVCNKPRQNVCQSPQPLIQSPKINQEERRGDEFTNNNIGIEEVSSSEPNQVNIDICNDENVETNEDISIQDEAFQCSLKLRNEINKKDQQIHELQLELASLRFDFP